MSNRDYYADLGLRQYANSSEIKQAFHALAKKHHPDKTGNDDASAFRMVHEAYEKLSDTAFRAEYDRTYVGARMEFNTDEVPRTRTAAYEAEEAEREAREERAAAAAYQEMLRQSPPPKMPVKKSYESGTSYYLGKAYTAWEKRDAAYRLAHPWYDPVHSSGSTSASSSTMPVPRGHGLAVKMTSHPCATESCVLKTPEWRIQTGEFDFCVFCLKKHQGGFRCPACEALACKTCLSEIIRIE